MDIVYHYCSVETFLNIIRNHTLRMSDLCKSTDRLELKSLLDAIKGRIVERYQECNDFNESAIYGIDKKEAFSFLTDRVIEKIKSDTDQMLFGICFSENGDLLDQWREYADKGTGLAIGFETKWFNNLCENELFKFSKVTYGYKCENEKIVRHFADELYEEMIYAIVKADTNRIINDNMCLSHLIQMNIYVESIFIKREEYKNEKEWRLILNDESTFKSYDGWELYYNWEKCDGDDIYRLIPKGMEFMTRNGKIIPFLDLKFNSAEKNIPIKKIVIGPNCKVDELDILHLLGFYKYDFDKIEIVKSKSSYCV